MLKTHKKRKSRIPFFKKMKGFTIIEVLIVMAIAALIFLLVFLAIPSLQRDSRNNGRKHDAASLLAAISDCIANNGNNVGACENTANLDITAKDFSQYSGFHYGTSPPTDLCDCGPVATSPCARGSTGTVDINGIGASCPPTIDQPNYLFGDACNSTGTWFSPASSDQQYVVTYFYETGNGVASHCIEG